MKVYFRCSLPCLDFAGVSFTKWEPVEDIDFLSALVEPDSLGVFFFLFYFKQLWYQDISIWVWGFKSTTGSGVCFLTETVQRTHTCVCPYCTVQSQKRWCAICTILQKMTAIIRLCQGAARHHGYKQLLKGGCCYSVIKCKCVCASYTVF